MMRCGAALEQLERMCIGAGSLFESDFRHLADETTRQ